MNKVVRIFKAQELVLELGGQARVARNVEVSNDGTISFSLFDGDGWEVKVFSPETYGQKIGMTYVATYDTEDGKVVVMSK